MDATTSQTEEIRRRHLRIAEEAADSGRLPSTYASDPTFIQLVEAIRRDRAAGLVE